MRTVFSRTGAFTFFLFALTACGTDNPSSPWGTPAYDHASISGGFQLLGTHVDASCTACHASSDYAPLFQPDDGNDCVACHEEDYEAEHAALGFPTLCTHCHTPTVWTDGSFDHSELSGGFDLLAVHGSLPCTACHVPETFEPLFEPWGPDDCVACHEDDRPSAHSQRGYPPDCAFCHTPTRWSDGLLDHFDLSEGFALIGIHVALPCTFCHAAGDFEPFFDPEDANDCVTCHQSRYEQAHEGTGYPTTCVSCHTPTFWSDGAFNHLGISGGFELLGVHANLDCTLCHAPDTFDPLFDPDDADDCVVCHQEDYDGHHAGSGFPLSCGACHPPTEWGEAIFDHSVASGGFELLGVHKEKECTECHAPEDFAPLFDPEDETDCLACHSEDYENEHGGQGYPTDCTVCHSPTDWDEGILDHRAVSGGFDLLGIHAEKPCGSCHDPVTFEPLFDSLTEQDCVACHRAEYEEEHLAEGYPTTCYSCHAPTFWEDEDYDHDRDYFPIYTGEHAPRWSTCATCHPDLDAPADFTCFSCHVHNRAAMDQRHDDEDGYSYASAACVSCHPDGTADD